ncbi:MAG: Uma2 family endonuclease [Planctomycetota bacterium]
MIEESRDHALSAPVEYPESDGQPMGETDLHVHALLDVLVLLTDHFADRDDVYVGANNFLYWVEGDPTACVSPDDYVVFGVPPGRRRVFKTWVEGRAPSFVLEITSRKTRSNDLRSKADIYAEELGVEEYFLFDPEGDWIPGRLRGQRLERGDGPPHYREVAAAPGTGRVPSRTLGLELGVRDGELRFFRPGALDPIPTRVERAAQAQEQATQAQEQAAQAQEQAAQAQEQAAQAQEQAAQAQEQAAQAQEQAAQAQEQAAREHQRAERERARADEAQAELARLQAELERLRGGGAGLQPGP